MSLTSILNIGEKVLFDDSIESIEYHCYNPCHESFKNNDEIRICINSKDLILLPSRSHLIVEGDITKDSGLINNAGAFLFQDIRYELNGVEIDRTKNCGITTTMKGLVSHTKDECYALENSGWDLGAIKEYDGTFSFTIPLSHLLGFAEDYNKVIMNAKHELILNRSSTDINSAVTKDATKHVKININRVIWRMPVVKVSDKEKLNLLRYVEGNIPIPIAFRTWDLYEYPLLPTTTRHVWAVKTTTLLEKPRYVILGFQTARKNEELKDMSLFDHCNFYNARLYLNSQYYPYDSFAADFEKGTYSLSYESFIDFQKSFYDTPTSKVQVDFAHFKTKSPLIVIDCSRQNDTFKTGGSVDIKIELEFKKNVPANTTAYCLVISDSLYEYSVFTNTTRKVIQ